jgi:uncharacterized NAD(P)/FAD-binding protein YdhS
MAAEERADWPVAIAGGGFSGTMLAAQLARRGVRSLLADGSGRLGRGVAYSTGDPVHILNVPAAKMSAWPEAPTDFAEWISANRHGDGTTFARRSEFGRYLGEQLAGAGDSVTSRGQSVADAQRTEGGWRLRFADGTEATAAHLVLAQGNQPPAPFGVEEGLPAHLFINDPWSEDARAATQRLGQDGGTVLILGTGLTMIDTMLSLCAAGHDGPIVALSRRGLAPRAHGPTQPRSIAPDAVPFGNVRALARWLRAEARDGDWRAAVDQLRPHSQALWRSWDLAQQRRFLRHARPWWDVHRHRIAPQVAGQLEGLRDSGRIEVLAGRLTRLVEDGEGLRASIALRSQGGERDLSVAAVFNCTGPLGTIDRTRDPLLGALLASREVQPDAHRLGLEVRSDCRAGQGLWALGPLTKGAFWEILAVPDIRGQCAAVADAIARELQQQ